ncbi:MAG: DNA polymerase IV [Hyphomicrobiaceae bacterium]|nr:DNA polymerase IV [Hyphomicrobiaceae bacterium]
MITLLIPHTTPTLCRACETVWPEGLGENGREGCPACGLPTLIAHPEMMALSIAHVDCDAFYASIEKRDNPELRDKPVIVGHAGGRGVVTTACYVARRFGPRSAMPMFKALELCPDAVVIPPDMAKYRVASRQIRALMEELTPVIEPLSLDEAYLDLGLGVRLEPEAPAVLLARLAKAVKREVGISISIGLAPNKFLAKLASDMQKPRGYSVIGRAEAKGLLAPMPVKTIHGVGPATARRLEAAGIVTISQLQRMPEAELTALFGRFGRRLAQFVQGEDPRQVTPDRETKSISAETTFRVDKWVASELIEAVTPLCDKVAERLQRAGLAGSTVVLKLKTSDFRTITRNRKTSVPTQRADVMAGHAAQLIRAEADGRAFRLIGIGVADLVTADEADPPGLFD